MPGFTERGSVSTLLSTGSVSLWVQARDNLYVEKKIEKSGT